MRIYLDNSNIFANFGAWIGGSCKSSDKGKLTAFPRFTFCQQNFKNVSNMLSFEELPEINSERWLSLEDLPGEEWRENNDYDVVFMISSYGRVKTLDRIIVRCNQKKGFLKKGRVFRLYKRHGYYTINIRKNNIVKSIYIHRLVAMAFVEGNFEGADVNHRNENKNDNRAENLEWCTHNYNCRYGTGIERRRLSASHYWRPVIQLSKDGNIIKRFDSIADAAREHGVRHSNLYKVLSGREKSLHGYLWKFEKTKRPIV